MVLMSNGRYNGVELFAGARLDVLAISIMRVSAFRASVDPKSIRTALFRSLGILKAEKEAIAKTDVVSADVQLLGRFAAIGFLTPSPLCVWTLGKWECVLGRIMEPGVPKVLQPSVCRLRSRVCF